MRSGGTPWSFDEQRTKPKKGVCVWVALLWAFVMLTLCLKLIALKPRQLLIWDWSICLDSNWTIPTREVWKWLHEYVHSAISAAWLYLNSCNRSHTTSLLKVQGNANCMGTGIRQ